MCGACNRGQPSRNPIRAEEAIIGKSIAAKRFPSRMQRSSTLELPVFRTLRKEIGTQSICSASAPPKGRDLLRTRAARRAIYLLGPYVSLPRARYLWDRAAESRLEGIRAEFEVLRTAPRCHPYRDRRERQQRDRRYRFARPFPAFVAGWSRLPLFSPLSVQIAPLLGSTK